MWGQPNFTKVATSLSRQLELETKDKNRLIYNLEAILKLLTALSGMFDKKEFSKRFKIHTPGKLPDSYLDLRSGLKVLQDTLSRTGHKDKTLEKVLEQAIYSLDGYAKDWNNGKVNRTQEELIHQLSIVGLGVSNSLSDFILHLSEHIRDLKQEDNHL